MCQLQLLAFKPPLPPLNVTTVVIVIHAQASLAPGPAHARDCKLAHLQEFDNAPHAEQAQDEDDVERPPSRLIRNYQHDYLHTTHISAGNERSLPCGPVSGSPLTTLVAWQRQHLSS